jgi:catechol 2,3-dioxygenase-like lactoylglutathione lyase family enzyme
MSNKPHLIKQYSVWKMDDGTAGVRDLEIAITFYTTVFGFQVIRQQDGSAVVQRDAARLRLFQDAAHDPATAGSCGWRTDDIHALHEELSRTGAMPGPIAQRDHEGEPLLIFFAREAVDGYCFCFTQAVAAVKPVGR